MHKNYIYHLLALLIILLGIQDIALSQDDINDHPWFGPDFTKTPVNPVFVNPIDIKTLRDGVQIIGSDKKLYTYGGTNTVGFSHFNGWPSFMKPSVPSTLWNIEHFLPEKEWKSIGSVGESVSTLLSEDGEIWMWGGASLALSNERAGHLNGTAPSEEQRLTPNRLEIMEGGAMLTWDRLEHTFDAAFAKASNGKWYSWGYSSTYCLLGHASENCANTYNAPQEAMRLTPEPKEGYKTITGGSPSQFVAWIGTDDKVYFIGRPHNSTSATPTNTATELPLPAGVNPVLLTAFQRMILVVGDNGKIYYVGTGGGPDSASGSTTISYDNFTELPLPYDNFIDVAFNTSSRAIGITETGGVYQWDSDAPNAAPGQEPFGNTGDWTYYWWPSTRFEVIPEKIWWVPSTGTGGTYVLQDSITNGLHTFSITGSDLTATTYGYDTKLNGGTDFTTPYEPEYQPWPIALANNHTGNSGSNNNSNNSNGDAGLVGNIDCNASQIIGNLSAGTASDLVLRIDVDVTTSGGTPVSVTGSGMTLKNDPYAVSTNSTGAHTFYIPLVYDGSAIGSLTFNIDGIGSCSADLNNVSQEILTTVDNVINLGSTCSATSPATINK